MKRTALFALIVMFLLTLNSTVAADTLHNKTAAEWKDTISESDDTFSDWKNASVHQLFAETTESKHPVTLWTVEQGDANLGYFVITNDGRSVLEYSPITPVQFRVERQAGTYNYAGPGMHLFQPKGDANAAWVNLANGERLPAGTVAEHLPNLSAQQSVAIDNRQFNTDSSAGNGLSAMIQHGLGQSVPFEPAQLTDNKGGYLVFTALTKDYYLVLAVKAVTHIQAQPMLKVEDVFAGSQYSFYVRSDAPVNWVGSK